MIFLSLINNVTLIIALSILYSFVIRRWKYGSRISQVISGLLFGVVAVVGMMNPLFISPGLIFDGRSIIISVAGFIGGWVTALIAAVMSIIYRTWLGGPGAIMGVSVIASSAAIGIAYHYIRRRRPHIATPLYLIGFGIIVHICMLALTMTLPSGMRYQVFSNIAIPVILIYPLGTVLVLVVLLDLESRLHAEYSLQKSEEKYRLVVENANEAILIAQDGFLKYVNPMTLKLLGYSEDLLTSTPFIEIIHPEDRERLFEAHRRRMRGEEPQPVQQFRVIARDGTFRLADSHAIMISWEGKPATLNYITDITERKLAEETLKKSEEIFRSFMEYSPIYVFFKDENIRSIQLSKNYEKMLGRPVVELLGKNMNDLFPSEFAKNMVADDMRILKEGKEETIEEEFNGRFYSTIKFPIFIDGKPRYLAGYTIDITERKRAEETLKRNEALLSASQKIAHVGSWEMDLASKRLTWSDEVYRIFGLEPQEFEASYEAFLESVHPEDRATVDAAYTGSIREGRDSYEIEHRIVLRNTQEIRFVNEKCIHIRDASGCIFCSIGMVQDITDRKQVEEEKRSLEERLNRAEKMESLGILAGGVAHDLNNVLGIVVGYAEMLLMGADKSSPVRSKLVNIMEAGQKAATIVGDLLTLARRGVSGRDVVNLNKIIADLQQSPEFEKLSSYNLAVKIKTDLDPDLLNISGSSVHLNKTLFNLVSNASEAMKEGGSLTIKTLNQYLDKPIQGYDEIRGGDYVVLSVSDTGEGISENDLKRIFEPFYTKKVMGRSGTGLGLAVVWGTVKDHNGYINVQSEEGKGSTFTLYFPVTREELSTGYVAVSISEYMGKGETILVVDDVKGQRDLAEEMLKKLNYSVTSSSSGEEALAYLKDHRVDLLVLDMIMDPGMDGLDTYKSVLEIRPEQKAIIVSGFSESDRVKAARDLGAGTYIKKPYVIEKLGLAVRKELDRSS